MFLLISCSAEKNESNIVLIEDLVKQKNVLEGESSIGISNGNEYVLYVDENALVLDKNNHITRLENTFAKKYWLHVSGEFVYVFWWVKYGLKKEGGSSGKALYVRGSQDSGKTFSKKVKINGKFGVLPDIHTVADIHGNIVVVYLDEREKGHQIYSNTSSDGGRTWLNADVQLNMPSPKADVVDLANGKPITKAVTPRLKKQGSKIIAMWEQLEKFNGESAIRLMSRTSLDFGKTWEKPVIIYTSFGKVSIEFESTVVGDKVYLMAVLTQGLVVFEKQLSGEWIQIKGVAPDSDKALVSYIKTASDEKYLYITYIYVDGVDKKSWHTELVRLDLETKEWVQGKYRFDAVANASLGEMRGGFQDVSVLETGEIIVVWEDYRGILPGIFINYSNDKGKNWLVTPVPLVKIGLSYSQKPFIKLDGKAINIYFAQTMLKDQTRPVSKTRKIFLTVPQISRLRGYEYPNQSSARTELKKRMVELMELRGMEKKGLDDYEKEWVFIDPIYRANVRKASWMSTRDLFRYSEDYNIKTVEVTGALAKIRGNMTFSLENDLPGIEKKFLLKDKKQEYMAKWGWFYDNWYIIPEAPTQSHLP